MTIAIYNETERLNKLMRFHKLCIQSSLNSDKIDLLKAQSDVRKQNLQESVQRKHQQIADINLGLNGIKSGDNSMVKAALALLRTRLQMTCELYQALWDRYDSAISMRAESAGRQHLPHYMGIWSKSKDDLSLVLSTESQLGTI